MVACGQGWFDITPTFTIYENFGVVTIRTHQHGLGIDLFFRQAGLAVDDLQ
jgi:hypothetical protein